MYKIKKAVQQQKKILNEKIYSNQKFLQKSNSKRSQNKEN